MKVFDENRELIEKFIWALEQTFDQIENGMRTSDWDVFQSYLDCGITRIESRNNVNTTPCKAKKLRKNTKHL